METLSKQESLKSIRFLERKNSNLFRQVEEQQMRTLILKQESKLQVDVKRSNSEKMEAIKPTVEIVEKSRPLSSSIRKIDIFVNRQSG